MHWATVGAVAVLLALGVWTVWALKPPSIPPEPEYLNSCARICSGGDDWMLTLNATKCCHCDTTILHDPFSSTYQTDRHVFITPADKVSAFIWDHPVTWSESALCRNRFHRLQTPPS